MIISCGNMSKIKSDRRGNANKRVSSTLRAITKDETKNVQARKKIYSPIAVLNHNTCTTPIFLLSMAGKNYITLIP